MNKNWLKFGVISVVIVGVLGWLAVGGIQETNTYYKTIKEVAQMGDQAQVKRLRVGGDVEPDIRREGQNVYFTIHQEEPGQPTLTMKVVYSGIEPLPDTFKPGSQALADGRMGNDGVFHANKIQAKCASKYEAKPQVSGSRS
jgi:cytochrome c-type biogenesis protein CcmE